MTVRADLEALRALMLPVVTDPKRVRSLIKAAEDAVKPVVEKAMKRGIKVFTWDSDAPDTKRIFYVAAADDVVDEAGDEVIVRAGPQEYA